MRIDGNSAYDNKEDEKRKWNYRYTMVAIIGVLLVAAAALIAFDNNNQWTAEEENPTDLTEDADEDLIGGGGINVVKPVPTVDSKDNSSDLPEQNRVSVSLPVNNGKITTVFSGNSLVYSKTLDQYVIHEGIDFEAPMDSPVMAVSEGTITKVYNDDKLGITIEVTHQGGYQTRYSNLSTDRMVEEGDVVKAGEVISGIGTTALFESLDSPHLHFEVWKDGVAVNPSSFMDL